MVLYANGIRQVFSIAKFLHFLQMSISIFIQVSSNYVHENSFLSFSLKKGAAILFYCVILCVITFYI